MSESIKAWHFSNGMRLDGGPLPPVGEWAGVEARDLSDECARIKVAHALPDGGMYAPEVFFSSRHPFDALVYGQGTDLCLSECAEIEKETDRCLAYRRRKILVRLDAAAVLSETKRRFAGWTLRLWDAPAVAREFLETGDGALRAEAELAAGAATEQPGVAGWAATDAWGAAMGCNPAGVIFMAVRNRITIATQAAPIEHDRALYNAVRDAIYQHQRQVLKELIDNAVGTAALAAVQEV